MDLKSNDLLGIGKEFGIQYVKRAQSTIMPNNHYHSHFEIYYLLSGERYYFIKDRTYFISEGSLVLIKPYTLHKTINTNKSAHERVLINFSTEFTNGFNEYKKDIDFLSCFESEVNVLILSKDEQKKVKSVIMKLLEENGSKMPGYNVYLKILLQELLVLINRRIKRGDHGTFEHPSDLHRKISDIVKYINANYYQHITLEDLSANFFISRYYLSRVFKEVTGLTFTEYLNYIRIEEAKGLLYESAENIAEVSERVGYESITHFGRVFKKLTGISPLKYRKQKSAF